jgi:hypothetical protein
VINAVVVISAIATVAAVVAIEISVAASINVSFVTTAGINSAFVSVLRSYALLPLVAEAQVKQLWAASAQLQQLQQ